MIDKILIGLVRCYQRFISPLMIPSCRFHPSCSEYASQAIIKYGVVKGLLKTFWRLGRCHPFHPGGYDPV